MGIKMLSAQQDILLQSGHCKAPSPYLIELKDDCKIIGVKSGVNVEQPGLHYDT